jgi:ABC-2 type transport system permease protein
MPEKIPASAHFRAVAYLRGRLFVNALRRKGGAGELAAQLIGYPIFAAFAAAPIAAAGFASYGAVQDGALAALGVVFWGVFLLWQVISINIAPPGLSFDPESLIRFPVSFDRYLVIRLFLGLLSASTVIGTLCLVAMVVGIGIAQPNLTGIAAAVSLAFAISNILFTRMVFAWIDRWLSTRRAREVFTGLIFVIGISFQYLNATYNGVGKHMSDAQRAAKYAAADQAFHRIAPYVAWLPPGLASGAIARAGAHQAAGAYQVAEPLLAILGILLYGSVFLAIFAWRMRREFQGESTSDSVTVAAAPQPMVTRNSVAGAWSTYGLNVVVAAVFEKELLTIRRSTSQFYGLIAPVFMVLIFASRMGSLSKTGYAFPLGMGYSILGLAAVSYNSLGLDLAGVQFYFLAPVSFRSILIAKNLMIFGMTAIQLVLVYGIVVYATGIPPLKLTLITVLWVIFASFANVAVGNIRSLVSPKKQDPGKLARRQASQFSALMSIGMMLASGGIAAGLYWLGTYFGQPFFPVAVLVLLGVGAVVAYFRVLGRADEIALANREVLLEELAKAS